MLKKALVALCCVALLAGPLSAGPRERNRGERRAPVGERLERTRTLDDFVYDVRVTEHDDGRVVTSTTYTEAIPYDLFMDMYDAIQNDQNPPTVPASMPNDPYECRLLEGDNDNDGDGFVGFEEITGALKGPFIADAPTLTATFNLITPFVEFLYTSDQTVDQRITTDDHDNYSEVRKFRDQTETIRNVQSTTNAGINFGFNAANLPVRWGFSSTLKAELFRNQTITRDTTITRDIQRKWNEVKTLHDTSQISFTENSGRITAEAVIRHAGRPTTVSITHLDLHLTATDPETGHKKILHTFGFSYPPSAPLRLSAFGTQTLNIDENINTYEMVEQLALGSSFDFEVTGIQATEDGTGEDLAFLESSIASKTVMVGIHHGDDRDDADEDNAEFYRVAIDDGDARCPTVRELLETIRLPEAIEFDRLADNTLVVKRIFEVENVNDDWNVEDIIAYNEANDPDLTWGRWIVAYEFGDVTDLFYSELDIEYTPLHASDRIHLYYVTLDDFLDLNPGPGVVKTEWVANDGSYPAEASFEPMVHNGDVFELSVRTESQRSAQGTNGVGVAAWCGGPLMFQTVRWYQDIVFDSTSQFNVPDLDFYGVEVQNNLGDWLTISELLQEPGASVVQHNQYPDYAFTIRFVVSESFSGRSDDGLVPVSVRTAVPRLSSVVVGFRGYDVAGRLQDCRSTVATGDYSRHTVDMRVWYHGYDDDRDGAVDKAARAGGIDHRDDDDVSFEGAPEALDGIDNDGDILVDENPLICKRVWRPNETGTCVLDNRLGYYSFSTNVHIRSRVVYEDGGTGPWTGPFPASSVTLTMPDDLSVAYLEVESTYYPVGGGSFTGVNKILQLDPPDPDVFPIGSAIEAEDGLLVYPMVTEPVGSATMIHVPSVGIEGRAEYRIDVPVAGPHVIWTLVLAPDAVSDTMTVEVLDSQGNPIHSVDCDFSESYGTFTPGTTSYLAVTDSGSPGVPAVFDLPAGENTIVFRSNIPEPMLDVLLPAYHCPDEDGDGWTTCAGDCNDQSSAIHPGQSEICSTAVDDDCDGYVNEGCGGGGCRKTCVYEQF